MKTKFFSIEINAPAKNVWYVLWDEYHYRKWTSVFCKGSYMVADNWSKGSKVHFLSPGGEGMHSLITENKPNHKMFFTHIGSVKKFIEMPPDDESKEWTGARENYSLIEKENKTLLSVEMDLHEKYVAYFEKTFPSGLQKVKELAEYLYITIEAVIKRPIDEVWKKWNNPDDVVKWNSASKEWHTPLATNDLTVGGSFNYRMEAIDGSAGFNFEGKYTRVEYGQLIEYVMADGRKISTLFEEEKNRVKMTSKFQPEQLNSYDLQREGWQSILNNFTAYCENKT